MYVTVEDVINYAGYEGVDFKSNGSDMSEAQFRSYLETFAIPAVTGFINRYCNVKSFEAQAIVELRRGRGATGDEHSAVHTTYQEDDRIYLFREYPVNAVTKVEIDRGGITGTPLWSRLYERSESDSGSYVVVEQTGLKFLYFTRDVPPRGYNSLRLTYTTGFPEGSDDLATIRLAAVRLVTNILVHKKKMEEATTIRSYGLKDYSQMFDVFMESRLLTDEVRHILDRYRRPVTNVGLYE